MQILTTRGLLERADLQIVDISVWTENSRKTATEYRYRGELVKRTVFHDYTGINGDSAAKVMTTRGPIDRELLQILDVVTWSDNAREHAVEYRLEGELVKRSAHIDFCRPAPMDAVAGQLA